MIPIAMPRLSSEEAESVQAVLDSGQIASGPMVTEFERAFADFAGAPFGTATTSGTTALEVVLRSLGVSAGDRVLTTPFSFIASTNAIVYLGADPVFCDVDPDTFNLDPEAARRALEADPAIRVILPVHLFGQCCDMGAFRALAKEFECLLVEDAAQAHGACWNGEMAGSMGDASAFSFYPTKNMTTSEGGMALFQDDDVHESSRMLINHGMERRYHHDVIGYNYRMTSIAAAIGLEQLKKLPVFNEARRSVAAIYDERIDHPSIRTPHVADGAHHVYHQYTLRVSGHRDALVAHLTEKGIGVGIYYPLSIPEQACYAGRGFEKNFPVTDRLKTEVLSIPVHPGVTRADAEYVADAINSFEE